MSEGLRLTHDHAFELLPWLVNGTLGDAERAAVDEHARTCIACRRELKEQKRLLGALSTRAATDVSIDAGLELLDAEIDATANGSRWRRLTAKAAPFAAAAAASLAVVALLLWLTPFPVTKSSVYTTLTATASIEAPLIDVVFAEDATAAQIRQLLDDIDGEIVAGPSDLGRYTVRLTLTTEERLGEELQALRNDTRVRFAGRSFAEIEP